MADWTRAASSVEHLEVLSMIHNFIICRKNPDFLHNMNVNIEKGLWARVDGRQMEPHHQIKNA
jgi:hypothetical protein